jgi:hypothetical protein
MADAWNADNGRIGKTCRRGLGPGEGSQGVEAA